jgi:hypothetical protein
VTGAVSVPLTIRLVCGTHTAPVKKAPDRNQVLFVCDIAIDYGFALAFAFVFVVALEARLAAALTALAA